MRRRLPIVRFLAVHSLVAGLALAGVAPHVMACSPVSGESASRADSARPAEPAAPACCCGADKGRCGMTACCGLTAPRNESPVAPSGHVESVPVKLLGIAPVQPDGECRVALDPGAEIGIGSPAAAGYPSTLQARHVRLQV